MWPGRPYLGRSNVYIGVSNFVLVGESRNCMEKSRNNLEGKKEGVEKDKEALLDDLRLVGSHKPLGYLPIETLIDICHVDPEAFAKEMNARGLKTLRLNREESAVWSGALYVYDEHSLSQHLESHRELLQSEGWPTEAEAFVRNLRVHAKTGTELFNVIADAFSDKDNPGRKRL